VQYSEVFWGVLSTFAAFLVGLAWQRLSRVAMHLRARRFWRPLVSHDSTVVVGSFRDLPGFEASGVIGMGDNIALNDLQRYFAGIGFKRFTVHYSDRLEWAGADDHDPLQGNLILLGGPDANKVTRLVLERVALGIEFLEIRREQLAKPAGSARLNLVSKPNLVAKLGWRGQLQRSRTAAPWRIPVILDKESGRLHAPVLDQTELRSDCGMIIRCPNPFNERREVIIFCGSYGYGTWAAVRYAQTKAFFSSLPSGATSLECVLSVEVVSKAPQGIRVEILRSVNDPVPMDGACIVVPRIVD
jgi:hypothetical protein